MKVNEASALFLSVIEAHKGILYKIANSYCKDPEDRKDLVQEIIVQLWKSFDRYTDQYRYSTWIYRIALNAALSFYRKEARRKDAVRPLSDDILSIAEAGISVPKTLIKNGFGCCLRAENRRRSFVPWNF